MQHSEVNQALSKLRHLLEAKAEENAILMKLLEIIEMLIDRREEDNLLVKERLEEIIKKKE